MINKKVTIIKGPFKGQRGIVTQVNGDEAIVELSTRAKKVAISKLFLQLISVDESSIAMSVTDQTRV